MGHLHSKNAEERECIHAHQRRVKQTRHPIRVPQRAELKGLNS